MKRYCAPKLLILVLSLTMLATACAHGPSPSHTSRAGAHEPQLLYGEKANRDSDSFSERITLRGPLNNGGGVYFRFMTTNLMKASGRAEIRVYVTTPKARFRLKTRQKSGQWRWSQKGIDIQWQSGRFTWTGRTGYLEATGPDGSVHIKLDSKHRILTPRSGNLYLGQGRFVKTRILIPRGRMTLTFKTIDSKTSRDEGISYAEQNASNVAPFNWTHSHMTFRDIGKKGSLLMGGVKLTETFGGNSKAWLLWVGSDGSLHLEDELAMRVQTQVLDQESGYTVPTGLLFKGKKGMALAMKTRNLLSRSSPLKRLSAAERFVVSLLMKPWSFRFLTRYALAGNRGFKIVGEGTYTYQQLKP